MTTYSFATCRFCGKSSLGNTDDMVKYGVRHYAHFRCYLEAGKSLTDLRDWQIVEFPALLLHKHGLTEVAEAAIARLKPREDR